MTTSQMIADFTTLAIQAGGWMELDRLYLQNRLLSMIGEQELGHRFYSNNLGTLRRIQHTVLRSTRYLPYHCRRENNRLSGYMCHPPGVR